MAGERFSVASLELQLQARAEFVPVPCPFCVQPMYVSGLGEHMIHGYAIRIIGSGVDCRT